VTNDFTALGHETKEEGGEHQAEKPLKFLAADKKCSTPASSRRKSSEDEKKNQNDVPIHSSVFYDDNEEGKRENGSVERVL